MNKILISACLSGFHVRYNGSGSTLVSDALSLWQQQQRLVVCCPEMAAGFSIPRPPAEITVGDNGISVLQGQGQVRENNGQDVTERFLLGAYLALEMAQAHHCRYALLTDGSPSCGSQMLYDGNFSGVTRPGAGVAAQLLRQHGIIVYSHHQIDELVEQVKHDDRLF